jgi:pimeloyl-ACP methyl ester carboxylesterase
MHFPSALIAAAFGVLATSILVPTPAAALDFNDCELKGSQGIGLVQARCATLRQPENPEQPNGATVKLKVAVIESLSPEPKPDAFTIINGGPGGSSIALYAQSAGVFSAILRERDIVVIDQRGTGLSTPLDCPQQDAMIEDFNQEAVVAATRECLAELDQDPRYFTTSVAVKDLDAVRDLLGYQQLSIYGVSYGTRVALHYARRYPERTRALIIDGVVPPELALGPNAALNAQNTLNRLLTRCHSDPDCANSFPELRENLNQLLNRLQADSVTVEVADPLTGALTEISISVEHLAITLRMLSYAPETAALIPLIINQAYQDLDYRPIASNALRILNELQGMIRAGMHNAVVCAEDIPFLGEVDWAALDATYLGSTQSEALLTICERWPSGVIDPDLKDPITLPIPTLILSGEEDPITPPAYGEIVASQMPDSLHLIGPGQGHGIFNRGCIPGLISKFVETTDLQGLETQCIERLRAMPFFLDSMGPAP